MPADEEDEATSPLDKVATVPPPPGEDSAYDAPTRVGETAHAVLAAMKRASVEGTPLKPLHLPTPAPMKVVSKPPTQAAAGDEAIPRIRHEEDDEIIIGETLVMTPTPRVPTLPQDNAPPSSGSIGVGLDAQSTSETPHRSHAPIPYPHNFVEPSADGAKQDSRSRWLAIAILVLTAAACLVLFYLRRR
jgi:hypothetical protein